MDDELTVTMTADLAHDETEILPPAPVDYERKKESLMNFDRRSDDETRC